MAKAWLNAPYHGENIAGEFQIVFDRSLAAEMSNGNAQQIMRAAEKGYRDYLWEVLPSGNFFIVEGTRKQK